MNVIVGSRQSGKTTQLIEMMKKNPESIMLVHSAKEIERLGSQHHLPFHRFLSVGEKRKLTETFKESGAKFLVVDNLDIILPDLLGIAGSSITVEVVSMTGWNL